jgi:hypothetical protein
MSKLQSRAKMLFYLGLALAVSWTLYIIFKSPITAAIQGGSSSERMDEAGELEQSGPNMLPSFAGMIQVYDLPAKYLPKMENHHHSGRLVIVGDVHGMLHELIRLLDKVHFDKDTDHLILAGDLISKGPDSTGVVDLAMSLGATAVRGNHEDRIIMANAAMSVEKSLVDLPDAREEMQNEDDSIPEESSSHRNDKDCALAKLLGKKRIQWLEQCPIILRVGKLGSMGEVVVVHAGLAPAVKLEQQDPYMAMNMRTISGDGVPSDKRLGVGWIKVCQPSPSLPANVF